MPLLRVDNIRTAPWGFSLLKSINLSLKAGEIMALIGPNGSGKSSLLHTIAGGVTPTEGTMLFNDRELLDWQDEHRARSIALQAQQSGLNFPFSVEDVILLGRIPHASGSCVDRDILEQVMHWTDTEALRYRLFTQLSGGEKQRVQLARAVAQIWRDEDTDGRLLLLDEPSAALDLAHQKMVLQLAKHLASQGVGVIISSHDFNLIASHADKILVLDDGHQYSCGSPKEVLNQALFKEVFNVDVLITEHPSDAATPLVVQL